MDEEEQELLKKFGGRVRYYREQMKISQEKLAELSNLHRTYIGSIERAEKAPTLITIWRIARALHVQVPQLIQ